MHQCVLHDIVRYGCWSNCGSQELPYEAVVVQKDQNSETAVAISD